MAHKVLLDLALPRRVLASPTSGPLHMLFPLPGKLPHPLSLANSFTLQISMQNNVAQRPPSTLTPYLCFMAN